MRLPSMYLQQSWENPTAATATVALLAQRTSAPLPCCPCSCAASCSSAGGVWWPCAAAAARSWRP